MKSVFIGPLLHWLIVIALVAAGWISGSHRMHVSQFNPFIVVLVVVTFVLIVVVLKSSPQGRRVTRDPVTEKDEEAAGQG